MTKRVVCLRPKSDFLEIGVRPPESLDIIYTTPADTALPDLLREARALVIPAIGPALPATLFADSALVLVQVTGAGLDRLPREVLRERGIALANVPGGSNAAVADYVTATSLSLLRRLYVGTDAIRRGDYADLRQTMIRARLRGLEGLLVGIVGMGKIGLAVAERCRALGADIGFYDPVQPGDPTAIENLGAKAIGLDALLKAADVVSLHVPLSDGTKGLIDKRRLGLMKEDAILINAARGGIVDETALADALSSGRLGGAAVDVYSNEPPEPDDPLINVDPATAERLILTPHIAGVSRQSWQHLFTGAWANVERVLIHGLPARHAT